MDSLGFIIVFFILLIFWLYYLVEAFIKAMAGDDTDDEDAPETPGALIVRLSNGVVDNHKTLKQIQVTVRGSELPKDKIETMVSSIDEVLSKNSHLTTALRKVGVDLPQAEIDYNELTSDIERISEELELLAES